MIIGSEHVALSAVLTLKRAGCAIGGLVEEAGTLHTYPSAARAMARWCGFPIYSGATVQAIRGMNRVEGVDLLERASGRRRHVPCDTVVITGRFRPEAALIAQTGVDEDPFSGGPAVDMRLMTSAAGIYAAGNILRGANMHDLCALEGRQAAESIVGHLGDREPEPDPEAVVLQPEGAIRFVVPRKILLNRLAGFRTSWHRPGVSFQTDRTLHNASIEARCGGLTVWRKTYSRILARTTVPLPIERFDWSRVAGRGAIRLTCRTASDGGCHRPADRRPER